MQEHYAIIRTEKFKSMSSLKARLDHNHREKPVPNADQNIKNRNLLGQPKSTEEAIGRFNEIMQGVKKPRKDSVIGIEYLMTSCKEYFDEGGGKGELNLRVWTSRSLEYIEKIHGKENIVSATIHVDERTPHLHVIVVPVVKKARQWTNPKTGKKEPKPGAPEERRLCARDFLGGPEKIRNVWTGYARHMEPLGLRRARIGSKATRNDLDKFYAYVKETNEANDRSRQEKEQTEKNDLENMRKYGEELRKYVEELQESLAKEKKLRIEAQNKNLEKTHMISKLQKQIEQFENPRRQVLHEKTEIQHDSRTGLGRK